VRELTVKLRGNTWNHVRGLAPLLATAEEYRKIGPAIDVNWEVRSLQDFGSFSVVSLAHHYDLLVIDHPHLGDAARGGALVPLDRFLPIDDLRAIEKQSVGPSYASYVFDEHVWALPLDAAAQVSVYRPDLFRAEEVPSSWEDVLLLAKGGGVIWPLKPIDSICSFMTLAASRGTPIVQVGGAFMNQGDATAILEAMREVVTHIPVKCLAWDPIAALSALASDQTQYRYIPLAFAYSNYSRAGFAAWILRAANIPGKGSEGSLLGGAGIAVSASSRYPMEALQHAVWLTRPEVQRTTYVFSGGQPAATAAWGDERANGLTDGFFERIRRTMEGSWLRPRHLGFPEWQDSAGYLVNAFLAGTASSRHTATGLIDTYERIVGPSQGGVSDEDQG